MNNAIIETPLGTFELFDITENGFTFQCLRANKEKRVFNFNLPFDAYYMGFAIKGYFNNRTNEVRTNRIGYGTCYRRDENFKYYPPSRGFQWTFAPELNDDEKVEVINWLQTEFPKYLNGSPAYREVMKELYKRKYQEAIENIKDIEKEIEDSRIKEGYLQEEKGKVYDKITLLMREALKWG
jgi:hypothetical protein